MQNALDEVWANADNFPNTEKYGEIPQSAMVITDKQGDIVGIAGGRGEKTSSRGFSYASDARRQPGSSIKPLATYGPAMDAGIATPDTTVYDRALIQDEEGNPWPMNDGKYPTGRAMTVKEGMTRSLNTISAQLLKQLTPQKSYEFMTQQLGFKLVDSRTNEDGTVQSDIDLAPLALGALTDGVTVREMAGGFSTFINDGVYGGTRTYTKVTDSEGNTIMENTPNTDKGFTNVRTDYYMLDCLQNVTAHGTAYGIQLDGVETGGKTGTTDENRDRYFAGFSPYYSAAVWTGYKSNERFSESLGNPSAVLWREVMRRIHDGLENKDFNSCSGLVQVTVCQDSGLLATDACTHDLRGNRVTTVTVAADTAPTQSCNVHKMVRYCKDGKHLATEYCPASSVVEIAALDWNREIIKNIKAQDDEYLLQTLTGKEEGELCPVHNKKPSIFPIIPGDDDDDDDDTRFGSWSDWWDKLLP